MRHLKAGWKLGRNTSHRRALLRNLVTSLILEERVETTVTKAKAMRPEVEKMITLASVATSVRAGWPRDTSLTAEAVTRLFDTVAPRLGDRNGGYLRIVRTGFRKGDGGETAFIELVGAEQIIDERRQKRADARAKRAEEARKAMEEAQAQQGGETPAAGEGGEAKE